MLLVLLVLLRRRRGEGLAAWLLGRWSFGGRRSARGKRGRLLPVAVDLYSKRLARDGVEDRPHRVEAATTCRARCLWPTDLRWVDFVRAHEATRDEGSGQLVGTGATMQLLDVHVASSRPKRMHHDLTQLGARSLIVDQVSTEEDVHAGRFQPCACAGDIPPVKLPHVDLAIAVIRLLVEGNVVPQVGKGGGMRVAQNNGGGASDGGRCEARQPAASAELTDAKACELQADLRHPAREDERRWPDAQARVVTAEAAIVSVVTAEAAARLTVSLADLEDDGSSRASGPLQLERVCDESCRHRVSLVV